MRLAEILGYEFVQNAVLIAVLASLLCGLVGTFVVIKRLVFISGGVSHAAFGGLGVCHFLGLPPLLGAGAAAILTAILVSQSERQGGRSRDARIGILWAVGMAVGVVFIALTPGYAPNLTSYLFGDILAVSRPLLIATAALSAVVLVSITLLFKELVAVSFDEEFARAQGLPVRRLMTLLMVLIALSVVLLIQAVGAILSIALLTIPPTISLSTSRTFRGVMLQAVLLGLAMTLGGLTLSFAWNLPSGPSIVLLGFAMLLVANGWRALRARRAARAFTIALMLLMATTGYAQSTTDADGGASIRHLELLGEAVVMPTSGDSVPLGGLSGLTFDADRQLFYAVSDDRAETGPARFYTLQIDLREGHLETPGVRVLGWSELVLADGRPFGRSAVDPEGITLTPNDTLVISSEGNAQQEIPPFLREFSLDGRQLTDFPLGRRYWPRRDGQSGVRNNLALESVSLSPDGRWLFSATENALVQDGPAATLEAASPSRILKFDFGTRKPAAEFLYWASPVTKESPSGGTMVSGVVEILALDEHTLLAMERSFSVGAGNDVRIYEVDLAEATDILSLERLDEHDLDTIQSAEKRLLLNVNQLGIEPDNLEGLTLGPRLADGSPTLLLLADDNFNPAQSHQLLAFALRHRPVTIQQIQGRGHRSPLEGDWVRRVEGVVTAVDTDAERGGFWMQSQPDPEGDDPALSNGIFVFHPSPHVAVGNRIHVDGAVREVGSRRALTVTRIDAGTVEELDGESSPPRPVTIGIGGRRPPAEIIDDDQMARFDPCCDAIDFYESLEGMRVKIERAVAASGKSRFGEISVLADGGDHAALRSSRGGIVPRSGDANPERLLVDDRLAPDGPSTVVGDLFRAPLIGVIDYSFANFKLLVESWPSTLRAQRSSPATPTVEHPSTHLSIASYNVLNLDPRDNSNRFRHIAETIVDDLGSPDLVGLQEVQDDNGRADEGVVSAGRTLELLIRAVVAAGGPHYDYRQIDPEPNADGGEPYGNIRVVWMFVPQRVRWVDRESAQSSREAQARHSASGGVEMSPSPGLIGTAHAAFVGDAARGWQGGRKCLAGEVAVHGQSLFLINCHLKSRHGDDPLFGATQPPLLASQEQRSAQARQVLGLTRQILSMDPDARVVVLGDMNEHVFAPPMRVLAGGTLMNLTEQVAESERYSFNFNGNSQLLDHILVSPALAQQVGGIEIVHVNADYSDEDRASDHDPVLAWFDLQPSTRLADR